MGSPVSANAAVPANRRAVAAKALAEGIGTFAMVLFGCGAAPGAAPFVFGGIVATMIYALGHLSGAHFNPAVTVAFAVSRQFPWRQVPAYVAAQVLGAILAAALLHSTSPALPSGVTVPALDLPLAFAWEVILTFFLMFVIVSVATDSRAVGIMAGAAIGGVVAVAAAVGGPLTGASMNPARSLGPALVAGRWHDLAIYLTAPFVGATLAVFVYAKIRCEPEPASKTAKGCC